MIPLAPKGPTRTMHAFILIIFATVLSNLFSLISVESDMISTAVSRESANELRNATTATEFSEVDRDEILTVTDADDRIYNRTTENPMAAAVSYNHIHDQKTEIPFIPKSLDPFSLKNGVSKFLQNHGNGNSDASGDFLLWELLENYHSVVSSRKSPALLDAGTEDLTFYYEDELSSYLVCGAGPGRGVEQDGGYKLLLEKIRFADKPTAMVNTSEDDPKVLCMVYTYSALRHVSRAQALLWGRHCDGFLAFSNETIPELGIYQLPDHQEESYWIMWQKTRKILKQAHEHFLNSFDYFYLSGDDVYLLVDNLRTYLRELEASFDPKPRHFGSWLPEKLMLSGGPGYVLNRAALEKYFENPPDKPDDSSPYHTCHPDLRKPQEDRLLSQCLASRLNIWGNDTDTRDAVTGAQRFHDTDPANLYTFRANAKSKAYFNRMAKFWEDQPMPHTKGTKPNQTALVGPKHGLEAASKYSISLHKIYTPTYLARIHAILHRSCPIDSPLGRGLQLHGFPEVFE